MDYKAMTKTAPTRSTRARSLGKLVALFSKTEVQKERAEDRQARNYQHPEIQVEEAEDEEEIAL